MEKTRHEEIEEALNSLLPIPPEGETFGLRLARHGFILGASWSEENTRKGLVDIDKACDWLDKNLINYWSCACTDNYDFINDFKNALEK